MRKSASTTFLSIACLLAYSAHAFETPAPAKPDPSKIARPEPSKMKSSEIRAFNATVGPQHRYYIVCKRSSVTGSWAKETRSCRTRDDWDRTARNSQADAQNTLERSRASAGCDPLC